MIKHPPVYDVSHWNVIPNFKALDPKPFLMITKATEGINGVDSTFVKYMQGMLDIGCHRGCYHFFRKAFDGTGQAKHFLNVVNGYADDSAILALDVEEGGEDASQLWYWFETVRAHRPRNRLMLYSRKNILEDIFLSQPEKDYFRKIPTWIAGYPNNPDNYDEIPDFHVPNQSSWGVPALWQYSEAGSVFGIEGNVDLNWINPTYAEILGNVPQKPPEGNLPMARYEATNTYGMSIRSTHYVTTFPGPLGYAPANSKIHGDTLWEAPGEKWLQITDVNGQPPKDAAGNVIGVPCWVAIEAAGRTYCTLKEINPPIIDPPTQPPSKVAFTLSVDGYKPYKGELEKA